MHLFIQESADIDNPAPAEATVALRTKKGMIRPRGLNQQRYVKEILGNDINFGIGPAGTGKTYLAVACAVDALEREQIRRTIANLSHTKDRRVVPAALAALASSDLADRVERLEITPEFLGNEEMSKLWSALQAKYRPSATYKVSTVVIDGDVPA